MWPHWPYPMVTNPYPKIHEFHNLGRGFHSYHNHTFSSTSPLALSEEESVLRLNTFT